MSRTSDAAWQEFLGLPLGRVAGFFNDDVNGDPAIRHPDDHPVPGRQHRRAGVVGKVHPVMHAPRSEPVAAVRVPIQAPIHLAGGDGPAEPVMVVGM